MGRVLIQTVALLVIALAAGFVHSRVAPVDLHLTAPAPAPAPAAPAATGPAAVAPAPTGVKPATPEVADPTGPTRSATGAEPKLPSDPPRPYTPAAPTDSGLFIDLPTAKKIYDSNDAIFIDARTYAEFQEGHVVGAMHIDKKYFDGAAPKKVLDYLPGRHVVIYCHGAECTDSEAIAKRLVALKLKIGPIHIIKDGYPGWKNAGYPVKTGNEEGF